jgi:putative glutamine amidotransferase
VSSAYLVALERAGATAVLLTPAHGEASRRELLAACDGLLLTGGEDVDPALYGQSPHPKLEPVCTIRDEMELLALEQARERGMPVLAICRGIQVLNVAFGGSLIQDLPSQRPAGLLHEQEAPLTDRWHDARVESSSLLGEIVGVGARPVNSYHHQAVDRVGEGLRPVAWSEDGVVEGLEAEASPWVVGVQWHPERGDPSAPEDDPDRKLFEGFVDAARKFAREAEH